MIGDNGKPFVNRYPEYLPKRVESRSSHTFLFVPDVSPLDNPAQKLVVKTQCGSEISDSTSLARVWQKIQIEVLEKNIAHLNKTNQDTTELAARLDEEKIRQSNSNLEVS